jgi:hypothetical protein
VNDSRSATTAELARIAQVKALIDASDGTTTRPLAEAVQDNLHHLWEHEGKEGATKPGQRPEWIYLRPDFICAQHRDGRGPVIPRLIKSKGLQLRLELLLLFDAQCRHAPGQPARNVRSVTPGCDEKYVSWRQLTLAATVPTTGTGRGPADLRARQITEALSALEKHHLVSIPKKQKRRQFNDFQLLSEVGSPEEHPRYTVPENGVSVSRHFFTSLWIFALTDTELATFLALSFLRHMFPSKHDTEGVHLVSADRESFFRLTRTAWRSTNLLHQFQLIDRLPDPRRNFRTGNVIGNFKKMWENSDVMPLHFKINDQALERPALQTIHQILGAPTEEDHQRRNGVSVTRDSLALPTASSFFLNTIDAQ